MAKKSNYYDVISAALDDMIKHGFDSEKRVEFWKKELEKAAQGVLLPVAQMEQTLRDALTSTYKKLLSGNTIAKWHGDVERFTLEKIAPHLRAELDRRILGSASLIKLNREKMINQTLSRFAGWATSIPKGGSKAQNKAKEKADLKKPMSRLPFEERRVLIDQSHKLTAAINEIVATDGQAIALFWHSKWRVPGYDYRSDHKERDGRCYTIRDNWAQRAGFMKPGKAGYYDKITKVAEEPFCRCSARWIYNLRDLPSDMLTAKGKDELKQVRAKLAS